MTVEPATNMLNKISHSQAFHHIPSTKLYTSGQWVGTNKAGEKKKRKRIDSHNDACSEGGIKSNHIAAASETKLDGSNETQPAKKKRRRKKKKPASGDDQTYKPVLIIKKPEDYSANWMRLKEIITKDDKPYIQSKPKEKSQDSYKNPNLKVKHNKKSKVKKTEESVQDDEEELDIWFDNVDPILLDINKHGKKKDAEEKAGNEEGSKVLKPEKPGTLLSSAATDESTEGITDVLGMDCEMVGVGIAGKDSMLARVAIVNQYGRQVYDKFVKPMENVEDYRTEFSGVRPHNLQEGAEAFSTVQREVSELINGRTLVGHAIHNDLKVLYHSHPSALIRDTQMYKPFRQLFGGKKPNLKQLTEKVVGVQIQTGEHNPVQDAQAAMRLYTIHRKDWEAELKLGKKKKMMMASKKQQGTGEKVKKKQLSKMMKRKRVDFKLTPTEVYNGVQLLPRGIPPNNEPNQKLVRRKRNKART